MTTHLTLMHYCWSLPFRLCNQNVDTLKRMLKLPVVFDQLKIHFYYFRANLRNQEGRFKGLHENMDSFQVTQEKVHI
jgi:hypothetical protein